MNGTKKVLAGLVFALVCGAQATLVTIDGTGNTTVAPAVFRLSGTHNWTSGNQYLLKGIILVGNGAVLNIEAGTVIRGANEITTKAAFGADFRPGALIVERGGKIYANGTAAHPIIMTDEWDNHNPWGGSTGSNVTRTWWYRNGSGTLVTKTAETYNYGAMGNHHGAWGGLVLCGKAFVNWDTVTSPAALGTATIGVEGIDPVLGVVGGGNDDEDSSGSLKYVQIRYGGYQLASTKEINGLTLYGVGRGTEIHHVEVLNNQDDMFEWFGGCVNSKYLVAWGNGDDIFDSDAGFRGKNQFLLGVQRDLGGSKIESGVSDKGLEMDGYETVASSGSMLFSASLWNNVTVVGAQYVDSSKRNVAISMRDNAAPQIYNSIFMDFGSKATFIENRTDVTANGITLNCGERFATANTSMPAWTATEAGGATVGPAYFYKAQAAGKQACLRGSIFWNIPTGLYPTEVGGTALKAAYSWVDSGAGKGPWCSTGLTLYSDWVVTSEGNITDLFGNSGGNNADANTTNLMPIKRRYRTATSGLITTGYHVTQLDPRAANDAETGAMYVDDGWCTPTAYRGAVAPNGNWAQGWTTVATFGLFGTYTNAPALPEQAATGTFNGLSNVSGSFTASTGTAIADAGLSTYVFTFDGVAGKVYQLQSTDSLNTPVVWTEVKTFKCDENGTKSIVDILGTTPDPAKFYRLVEGSVH